MKEGIDVTTKDGKGKTPAETAAANNQASCMLQLINATLEGAWQAVSAMLSNLTGHLTTSSHMSPRLQVWDKPVSVILKAEEKLWKLPFRRKKFGSKVRENTMALPINVSQTPGHGTSYGTNFAGGVGQWKPKKQGVSKKMLGLGVGAGFLGGAALGVAGTMATYSVYHKYQVLRSDFSAFTA